MKNERHFHHPSMYQCVNTSKCISKHRLGDGRADCWKNDEKLNDFSSKSNSSINNSAMIEPNLFPLFCDGYIDIDTNKIHNETDETNCNWWPCNNIYTRCDHIWNCRDGSDKVNCPYLPSCSPLFHPCISPDTFSLTLREF
jgi:hypothetical protein